MRPRKPRFVDGIQLVDNLYPDQRKRPGHFRFRRSDRTDINFRADTVEEANAIASDANAAPDMLEPACTELRRDKLSTHLPTYTAYQEQLNPDLSDKNSWRNTVYCFDKFARQFEYLRDINHNSIQSWWDGLTYYQQKSRHAAFRRLFNWLMREELVSKIRFNPFTRNEDKARLIVKQKPIASKPPVTLNIFKIIHEEAAAYQYEALQLAMDISLYTTLRESDVCGLRWDRNVVDGELRVVVSKSEAQKGTARATRLFWNLQKHPFLKKRIDRARELSLINRRCPFVISHMPMRLVWNQEKEHMCQVLPERLYRMFVEVRDGCRIDGVVFHGVRGLGSTLYAVAGYDEEKIQKLMAHEDVLTTRGYQDAAALPFAEIDMTLDL